MRKFILSLGRQPLANNFTKVKNQKDYNLNIFFDNALKLACISKVFDKKIMFDKSYPYRSSQSVLVSTLFKKLKLKIEKYKYKNILEIGSNDGAFATNFSKNKIVCIEPCLDVGMELRKKGYKVFLEYFDKKIVKKLKINYPTFDLIFSANTITHIPNCISTFKNISNLVSKNGIIIIEEPSLLETIKNRSYDQFYNEHIYIFSAIAVKNILKKTNLRIFKIENIKVHGGSLRYYITKLNSEIKEDASVKKQINKEVKYGLNIFKTYQNFSKDVINSKKKLIEIFKKIKKDNNTIIGYGASAKAVTILNFCNIDNSYIDYFLDTTKQKIGNYLPGTDIIVKKYKKLNKNKKLYVFLGAWNFLKEILTKEKKFYQAGGKFITHIPSPRILKK